jgi:hypothetical protein
MKAQILGKRLKEEEWQYRLAHQYQENQSLEKQGQNLLVSKTPDLSWALAVYNEELRSLSDLATAHRTRIIFLTVPLKWSNKLDLLAERQLWGTEWRPWIGVYHEQHALVEGIRMYNQELLSVCSLGKAECIDLASEVSLNREQLFTDFLPEEKAQRLAEVIGGYLSQTGISSQKRLLNEHP